MFAKQCDSKRGQGSVRVTVKPFCKVCFDTGKTEKEYSSHFVRLTPDPKSKVCCPTLLDMECQFCHLKGHTVSKCTRRLKLEKPLLVRHETKIRPSELKKVAKNLFEFLDDSDSEDLVDPVDDVDDVSTVAQTVTIDTTAPVFTYRDALTKPAPPVCESDLTSISTCNSLRVLMKYNHHRSWADATDSDDE
jgi:hypothetical protein